MREKWGTLCVNTTPATLDQVAWRSAAELFAALIIRFILAFMSPVDIGHLS